MSELVSSVLPDISKPRWSQDTYYGRARHFIAVTNPLNVFVSSQKLDECKKIVNDYNEGKFRANMTVDELWKAKTLYDSAFHPETGNKMFVLGRMSAQVPCNMIITGGMLTFHKKFSHVLLFQWLNQSFNAIVNYTNRSGTAPGSNERLMTSYTFATSGAVGTALLANGMVARMKKPPPLLGALVPFVAVVLANFINIPMMRSEEFANGIMVEDEKGTELGLSKIVPYTAVPQVILSRIGMGIPNMVFGPIIFNHLRKKTYYRSWMASPLQIFICGFMLAFSFSTPLCCAIFPQRGSIPVSQLEPELQKKINARQFVPTVVYFNKGL